MQSLENNKMIDELIVGYLKNELSDDQTLELIAWTKQRQENKWYFDQTIELWIISRSLNEESKYNSQNGYEKFLENIDDGRSIFLFRRKQWIRIAKVAAVIIVAFLLGGLVFTQYGNLKHSFSDNNYSEIIVPRGAKAHFILPDGSVVTLNAGSKLRYNANYGINDRIVELEGEGYFRVEKDKRRPFVVKTLNLSVKALGTEFNVKAYPGDKTIETTLVEGSVKVEKIGDDRNFDAVILKPNQKFTYFKKGLTKGGSDTLNIKANSKHRVSEKLTAINFIKEDVKVEPLISWKENRWIIDKQNLSELAVQLERKFDIQIVFKSERLKNIRFTGTLLNEPLEQVLKVMCITAPISYEITGKKVIFTEKENFEVIYRKLYEDNK